MSSTKAGGANPFPTRGDQFVYVKAGEWIAMASSMQGLEGSTEERIKLFDPNGNQITLDFSEGGGDIPDRASELAGPAFPGSPATGSQYRAVYYQAATDGIYKIQFLADENSRKTSKGNYGADEDWVQTDNNRAIAAWDVSVCNKSKTSWINGRVFMYVVNLVINSAATKDYKGGFYGAFKILTNDGYVYNVENNGMNGIYFTFMVNNRGFHEPGDAGKSLYKSINGTTLSNIQSRYHDPRTQDIPTTSTDKIFYHLPDGNMPETALGGQAPGQVTWMRPTPKILQVAEVSFTGAEGTPNQMGQSKGGYINFTSSIVGSYQLTIEPTGGSSFAPRVLTGASVQGRNSVYFDGKDGNGKPIPVGPFTLKIEMNVRFAEVHFPFIDVEINPYGIIIELLKNDFSGVLSDIVYWNDEDIPSVNENVRGPMSNPIINLDGISSNTNGHQWGSDDPVYKGGGTFGDKMGMDTWTYLEAKTEVLLPIKVKKADLKINGLTADKTAAEAGDQVTYHVDVKNDGPSDVKGARFTFTLPAGFEAIGKSTFNGHGCGTQTGATAYNAGTGTYTSDLDIPAGCTVSYTMRTKVTGSAPPGNQDATAAILRPDDISDPDATNLALKDKNNNPYRPASAQEECANNGSGGHCNNMMSRAVAVVVLYAVPDINQTPEGKTVTGNVLTNDQGNSPVVESAAYWDQHGGKQALPLGTSVSIYNKNHELAGKMMLNTDGSYSFMPQNDFTGKVTIQYTTKGQEGFTDGTSLEIKVIPVINPQKNDPPIAQNDAVYTEKNIPVSSDILNNDSDPDGDNLTVTGAVQGTMPVTPGAATVLSGTDKNGDPVADMGTLLLKPDGDYTFTPKNGVTGKVNPVTYAITDGNGTSDSGVVFITVLRYTFNQTFADDAAGSTPKGKDIKGNLLHNDFDPEGDKQTVTSATADVNGHRIILTIGTQTAISGAGKLTLNRDGSYTFQSDTGFTGTIPVAYTIEDNANPTAGSKATLYLTSLDVLKPPTAEDDEKSGQLLFTAVTIPVTDNDIPGGNDRPLDPSTVSLTGPPGSIPEDADHDGDTDKITVPDEGVWTVGTDGTVTFTPENGFIGNPTPIGYKVDDQGGLVSNEAAVTITYNQTPPAAADDSANGGTPGSQVSLDIINNDRDNNGTGIAPATINLSGPSGSTSADTDHDGDTDKITVPGEGLWTVDKNGDVTFIPDAGFKGDPRPVHYTVKDSAHFESNKATITIAYFHIPPVAHDDKKAGQVSGTPVSVPVLMNDSPGNSGPIDPASISLTGPPGSFPEDTNNDGRTDQVTEPGMGEWTTSRQGNITFTPAPGFMGDPTPVEYTVEDEAGRKSNAATVTIKTLLGDNYFIPNNFTPNGDGLNDTWKIFGNNIREIEVVIYNQYGQKIFESGDKNFEWNGRYKGILQPVGVYMYYAKVTFYDGNTTTKKGSVTLIR